MKALSTTILIVVTAVVILVAALVLLTIFGGGVGQIGTLTNFRNQCMIQCSTTCTMGGLPPTWSATAKVDGKETSCRQEIGDSCEKCITCPADRPWCAKKNACTAAADCT